MVDNDYKDISYISLQLK